MSSTTCLFRTPPSPVRSPTSESNLIAATWQPRPRATPPGYPRLPRLSQFSAHVVSTLSSSDLTIVLKIRWNKAFHILKLYQPPQPDVRPALEYEYTTYACLEQAAVSSVPRCRGLTTVKTKNLKFPKRLAKDPAYAEIRKQESWRGLVLEFVPDAVSLETYLSRGMSAGLKAKVVEALKRVHEAGVLHEDPVGRNCLVQRLRSVERRGGRGEEGREEEGIREEAAQTGEDFRIWWIDFDSSLTTGSCDIPEAVFHRELRSIEAWMRGEWTVYMC